MRPPLVLPSPMPQTLPCQPVLRLPPLHPHPCRRVLLPTRRNQHPHQPHHQLVIDILQWLVHLLPRQNRYPSQQLLIRLRRTQLRLQRHPFLPFLLRKPVRTGALIIPSHTALAHLQPKLLQTSRDHLLIRPVFLKKPRIHHNPLCRRQSLQLTIASYLPPHIISAPRYWFQAPLGWFQAPLGLKNQFHDLPKKASPSPDAGNQRLASNYVGKGGLKRPLRGKSCTIFPPPDRLRWEKPAFQPTFSHPSPHLCRSWGESRSDNGY